MYISKRTNASQLSGYEELKAIIKAEAKRPIIEEKRFIKLIDYSLAEQWLREVGIVQNPFDDTNDVKQIIEKSNAAKETIGTLTLQKMKKDKRSKLKELLGKITSYLYEEDLLQMSDLIFVFGGKNLGRIKRAVALWKDGWAEKIWISGGHPMYKKSRPEAERFKKWAMEHGVPPEYIYIESDSITIADNVRRSLNAMDEMGLSFTSMILVVGWYVQKRAWMVMEKYVPKTVTLITAGSTMEDDNQMSPETWYLTDYTIQIVFNEFIKMRIHDYLVMNKVI